MNLILKEIDKFQFVGNIKSEENLRELRAMQNKDKIYAPGEFTLH